MNILDFYLLKELHWILVAFFLRLVAYSYIKVNHWGINNIQTYILSDVSIISIPPFSHC